MGHGSLGQLPGRANDRCPLHDDWRHRQQRDYCTDKFFDQEKT